MTVKSPSLINARPCLQFAWTVALALAVTGGVESRAAAPATTAPDFLRDVRPILSSYCFKCHGPDDATRKGGVRLDLRDAALLPGKSGDVTIVPGQPDKSAVIRRIFSTDEDELMPPASVKHPLDAAQKDILQRWIAAGAEYRPHWAFAPIHPQTPPKVSKAGFELRNPIDAFVADRLAKEGLKPSPQADRLTLARRVSLDLVGLPPTPEEADAFAADRSPEAYERLVDRLLSSPRYGERWARKWLDLARYADSNGYEKDRDRSIWPYRDWVIRALNADQPFDQFTVEQLAGDLLPGATREQRVATGFHRNTMLNEEGGIDPLEFRFHAVVDRVNTTGTAWLGLTVGCAQCHTHKYDPILHKEYYQLMAFLNNADEPELDLPGADALEKEQERAARATKLLAELPSRWPVDPGPLRWERVTLAIDRAAADEGARVLEDGSILFAAPGPDRSDVTLTFTTSPTQTNLTHVRLEALTHPSLPKTGPGRTPHGNFVLSEINLSRKPSHGDGKPIALKIRSATASAEQETFPVGNAFDGREDTGWAVHQAGRELNTNQFASFALESAVNPASSEPGAPGRWIVRLRQLHGGTHTMGRIAISVGSPTAAAAPALARREDALEFAFAKWRQRERARAVVWSPLPPAELKANLPLLTALPDRSVLASGDISKSDTYDLTFTNVPPGITAIRLEALPDDSLPAHGPGLTYYEGPRGDFFLGEFQVKAGGRAVKFARATETYAKNNFGSGASAKAATDGDPQTGWSCADRPGEAHQAVFVPTDPITDNRLEVRMLFGRHYACSLGRFRISVTTHPDGAEARELPDDLAVLLRTPDEQLSLDARARLREHFLLNAPELAAAAKEIRALRKPLTHTTTLVMRERPATAPRPTFIHKRGEFLQPTDPVEAGVPQFLPALDNLPAGTRKDRLAFARWLVSSDNPLTPRVVANRQWAAFFGRGLVGTENDFGFQGDLPTHPELLDWLARKFIEDGWSLKKLHRLIVTSSTYRQWSHLTPVLAERDPRNRLLARGPRVRLDAEIIRDSALAAAGVLSAKMYGPPVRPPQPSGVTEVAYGSPRWDASAGEDRYRRSLYTFQKRSAPFAMFNTFDAPSGETCLARREVSNTPLQSLTLLNDIAFVEAAQKLGALTAQQPGDDEARIRFVFRRVLTRSPEAGERSKLAAFVQTQRERLNKGELNAAELASSGDGESGERAIWTLLARAVLNLDEAIVKQ